MAPDSGPVGSLDAPGLRRRLDAGDRIVLLDVREEDERGYCAIVAPATARDLHVPMGQIQARAEEVLRASRTGPLVVYCHHGARSLAVASWLAAQGAGPVLNLEGGIDAWSSQVDPAVPRY